MNREYIGSLKLHVSVSPRVSFTCSVFVNHSFSFSSFFFFFFQVPATKLNTMSKPSLGQSVSKYDLLVWFEISELEPTGE